MSKKHRFNPRTLPAMPVGGPSMVSQKRIEEACQVRQAAREIQRFGKVVERNGNMPMPPRPNHNTRDELRTSFRKLVKHNPKAERIDASRMRKAEFVIGNYHCLAARKGKTQLVMQQDRRGRMVLRFSADR